MKSKKHVAEQRVLPLEPVVNVTSPFKITGDHARYWRMMAEDLKRVEPSVGQLAAMACRMGLVAWAKEKGVYGPE